jgi:hypothetical protein
LVAFDVKRCYAASITITQTHKGNYMQHKFIVIDDTGNAHKHGKQFETAAEANTYVDKHALWQTHLVYDLSTAECVHRQN